MAEADIRRKSDGGFFPLKVNAVRMHPEDLHQLRKSFARVEAQGHVGALIFYQKLFALAPAVRPLFSTDIEVQSRKLTRMLTELLSLAEKPSELRSVLHALGARHVDYGALPEHYPIVVETLIEMLASVLGNDFTPALRAKWKGLLDHVSAIMLEGAAATLARRSGATPSDPQTAGAKR